MFLLLTYWMATVLVSVVSQCRPSQVWFCKRRTRQSVDLSDSAADLDDHGDESGVSGQPVLAQPGVAQQVQDQAAQLKQVCCQSEESPPVTLNSPSDHTQLSLSDF